MEWHDEIESSSVAGKVGGKGDQLQTEQCDNPSFNPGDDYDNR